MRAKRQEGEASKKKFEEPGTDKIGARTQAPKHLYVFILLAPWLRNAREFVIYSYMYSYKHHTRTTSRQYEGLSMP